MKFSISTPAFITSLLFSTLISAYRPVQFVKHTGESGRADQAFSIVNYFNETTGHSDLYVRMWMYRYESEHHGWASLALGPRMYGALMFIIYGDPNSSADMTLSVRTADGHHPPRPATEMKEFYDEEIPEVHIISSRFHPYTGDYYSDSQKAKPSHLGIADFIVYGYQQWSATELEIMNTTTKQAMIWSSNFKQDFQGDFSVDRAIDMHQFGLGFGFLWVDLLNAATTYPFFGEILDTEGHKGVNEIGDPLPPTDEELTAGATIIAAQAAGGVGTGDAAGAPDKQSSSDTPQADDGNAVEEPVKSPKQWNIRSLMWHLHGGLMTLAFLVLYPLGVYFLRSPRATAFNLHWTVNSLGSMSVGISAIIGFWQSRSISITHQYVGILLVCGLAVQTVLGWRHHVIHLQISRRTWMGLVHVWLGRVILPVGMINVLTGLLLRHYGWLTIALTIAAATIEVVLLTLIVGRAQNRRPGATQKAPSAPTAEEAEEYFQLTGDDDDELSDDESRADGGEGGAAKKAKERADQAKRLARLDKV
ncbi:hypothetical protein B0A52_05223 [Exophiala mesophila]|uniref:Cytochrome b561 domain-containing protein n=1 Tax=Exophiala mesophila TaxID=212818 RepID=A0A438N4G1_EXOME|nr:hypothetical protein B0A52_05223 [Exophiala mesophila]